MDTEKTEKIAARIKSAIEPARAVDDRGLRNTFATRLKQVAARPDVVPIEFDGRRIEVRRGGTLLGAAMKNGVRLMHVCGARTLCATCRVVVESGDDNLTTNERRREILAPLAPLDESKDPPGLPGPRKRPSRSRVGIPAMRRSAKWLSSIIRFPFPRGKGLEG